VRSRQWQKEERTFGAVLDSLPLGAASAAHLTLALADLRLTQSAVLRLLRRMQRRAVRLLLLLLRMLLLLRVLLHERPVRGRVLFAHFERALVLFLTTRIRAAHSVGV
jgi:hypothetical protein